MIIDVVNLGWGVQSFTMAAMVAVGELPPIDFAIHADTTHERSATYDFAKQYTPWLEARGVKIITVTSPNTEVVKNRNELPIPAFTISPTGKDGQLRRQCTDKWKIRPIRKYLRETYGKPKVRQWLGISLDEVQRMRMSDVKWIENVYPLIDKRMSRTGCISWLQKNGLDVPEKSACIFCPYHNRNAWRDLKFETPDDFSRAVAADNAIRNARPPYPCFVHPDRKPLETLDLRINTDHGQLSFLDAEECSGVCFL